MRGSRILLAAVLAAAGCKSSPRTGSLSNSAEPAAICGPLTVTADGEVVAGLRLGDAQLQSSMDSNGMSSEFYELFVSPYRHECGPELLMDTWHDDEPRISIGVDTAGKGFVFISQEQVRADVKLQAPLPAPGQPLDLCVRSAPHKASGGSLTGRTIQVTGRARVTYCGTRAELMEKHGKG